MMGFIMECFLLFIRDTSHDLVAARIFRYLCAFTQEVIVLFEFLCASEGAHVVEEFLGCEVRERVLDAVDGPSVAEPRWG